MYCRIQSIANGSARFGRMIAQSVSSRPSRLSRMKFGSTVTIPGITIDPTSM